MSAVPGRVVCGQCSANNFETQAACWKCGGSLQGGVSVAATGTPVGTPATALNTPRVAANTPPLGQPPPAYAPATYAPASSVSPSTAIICGVILALFFPAVAVPVGLVFMMWDDRRKLEVGKWTLIAGILSILVHLVMTIALYQVALQMIQTAKEQAQPGLTDEVGDGGLRGIPGVPNLGTSRKAPSYSPPPDMTGEVRFPDPPR